MKKIIRFIFPFLFERNWHDGSWELSRSSLVIFIAVLIVGVLAICIAYMMQAPVSYKTT